MTSERRPCRSMHCWHPHLSDQICCHCSFRLSELPKPWSQLTIAERIDHAIRRFRFGWC